MRTSPFEVGAPSAQRVECSRLDRSERADDPHRDLLHWHRALVGLRRTLPEYTPVHVEFDEAVRWLTLQRGHTLVLPRAAR